MLRTAWRTPGAPQTLFDARFLIRKSPLTTDQRAAEIARLEAKREYLLERAPKRFEFRRYLILPMLGFLAVVLLRTPWHSSIHNLGGLAVVGLFTPDRKSTRLNSSHVSQSRMPSSA